MTEETKPHQRLLSPEDAERWRERVRHGTAPNGVLAMVDEIERLYEQLEALREAMLYDWRMNKVDDLDYETPDGWAFETHPWFSLLGLTTEECITMLRGASSPATTQEES